MSHLSRWVPEERTAFQTHCDPLGACCIYWPYRQVIISPEGASDKEQALWYLKWLRSGWGDTSRPLSSLHPPPIGTKSLFSPWDECCASWEEYSTRDPGLCVVHRPWVTSLTMMLWIPSFWWPHFQCKVALHPNILVSLLYTLRPAKNFNMSPSKWHFPKVLSIHQNPRQATSLSSQEVSGLVVHCNLSFESETQNSLVESHWVIVGQ